MLTCSFFSSFIYQGLPLFFSFSFVCFFLKFSAFGPNAVIKITINLSSIGKSYLHGVSEGKTVTSSSKIITLTRFLEKFCGSQHKNHASNCPPP